MSFGSRLKELRLKNNLTQLELAKKINLSKANVSKYEANLIEPNLDTLTMISDLFNVSTDYLLEKEEPAIKNGGTEVKENVVIFNRNGKVIQKEFTKEEMNVISTMLESLKGVQDENL